MDDMLPKWATYVAKLATSGLDTSELKMNNLDTLERRYPKLYNSIVKQMGTHLAIYRGDLNTPDQYHNDSVVDLNAVLCHKRSIDIIKRYKKRNRKNANQHS